MADDIDADVIIVGSGIAGALLAAELAAGGVKVAILEAGAAVDRSTAVQTYWDAAIKVPECPYPPVPQAMHPISNDLHSWYEQAGPDLFASTYLKVVGGTTWHWLGTCLRLLPNDFRLKTLYGQGVDWPISYDELEPFYARAEQEIGVSGDAGDDLGSPRSGGYPMPAIPQTYLDKAFAKALEGTRLPGRDRRRRGGSRRITADRPACCGNASCIPVCPVQAKYDATIHLDRATAAGARLVTKATAVFVEVGADRRVAAIRFKRWDGSEGRATGKVFVLAAHAIETPRLLLNSTSEATPRGVANTSDQVGRNLMDHPTQLSWALAGSPVYPYRGPLSTSGIENLRDGDFRKQRGAFRIEIGNDGWSWPTGAPISTAAELAMQGLRGAGARQGARGPGLAPHPPRVAGRAAARSGEPRDARQRARHLRRSGAAARLSARRLHQGRLRRLGSGARGDLRPAWRHRASSTARRRRAPGTSSAQPAWATIPPRQWSIVSCAAMTTRTSSSSDRASSRPPRPPTRR